MMSETAVTGKRQLLLLFLETHIFSTYNVSLFGVERPSLILSM